MRLGNGTYISLWPGIDRTGKKKKKIKQQHEERSESLEEDIESEERHYDASFDIIGLDEAAMQRWWDNFKKNVERFGSKLL